MLGLEISFWNAALIIFFFSLIAHGLILFNDGVYWDGWLLHGWQRRKDFTTMRTFYSQVGMPFFYYFHRFMAKLPHTIFWYKAISFTSLFLSSFFVFLIGKESGFLTNVESLIIALLMLCYPGQQMTVEACVIAQYVFTLPFFFLASLLGLKSLAIEGITQWIMQGSSIVLFLISFNMNSLLVFYFGFIFLLGLFTIRDEGFNLFSITRNIGHYLALPFMFWFWKEKYTPHHGQYADYNRIHVNVRRILDGVGQLLRTGGGGVFVHSLFFFLKRPIGWVVVVAFGIAAVIFPSSFMLFENMTEAKSGILLLFGVFLLICGILPYILVGQPFGLRGWATKNNMLLSLPLALIIFGTSNLILKPSVVAPFLGVLLISFIIYLNYVHLCSIALYVKHRSMLFNLGKVPSAKDISIFGVCDQHPIRGSFDSHPEHGAIYLIYMFESLWGDVRWLGINEATPKSTGYTPNEVFEVIHQTTLDFALKDIDPFGEQASLIVKQGKHGFSEMQTAIRYLVHRFFIREKMEYFLSGTTQIEIIPCKAAI